MIYIDEVTRGIIEDPDLDKGEVKYEDLNVIYHYVVDRQAKYEEVVVAEYPETGGKDVQWQEVSPEEGHWEMLDETGEVLPYEIEVDTSYLMKGIDTPDIIELGVYHAYTPEEIEAREKAAKEFEEAQKEADEKREVLEALPDRVDTLETDQEDIVLLLADIVGGAV